VTTTREGRLGGYTETASQTRPHHTDQVGHEPTATVRQLGARRAASWRLPALDSGRSDPWHYLAPTAGYEAAALHLLAHGLTPAPNVPAMREMWKADLDSRRAVQIIAERWKLVA
jgi:hypothetical protein